MSAAESPGRGGSELRRSLVEATQRIDEILDAAEKVAEEIRVDAQREAAQYVERRRREADRILDDLLSEIGHLPDSLQGWVARVGEQTQRVTAEVEGAVARLRELGARGATPSRPVAPAVSRQD